MTHEALKLALEALQFAYNHCDSDWVQDEKINPAITAIKEALAKEKKLQALHHENERLGLYKDAYAQPEQEPVAWMDADGKTFPFVWNVSSLGVQQGSKYLDETLTPLYTTPPQRTWVGLTDEEFDDLRDNNFGVSPLISAVEAKLKERNT